ncbi:MAG: tripartite tricarboxylate transporter TctB family protein [Alkalilacustris sp.]
MRLNDALLGALLIVFGGLLAWQSRGFPSVPGQQIGAAAFPTLIAAGFALCGLVLLASGLRQGGALAVRSDWTRDGRAVLSVLAVVAAVVFYLLAARSLGFIPTMALILLGLQRLFGVGWGVALAVAVLVPPGMQYLFGTLLLVPLPWGVIEPVRWR